MDEFLLPFQVSIKAKHILIDVQQNLGDSQGLEKITLDQIRHLLCTDWVRYQEILFHLISNAIKFALELTTVQITFNFKRKAEDLSSKPLCNIFETKIVNFGENFQLKKKNKRFKTFAFDQPGQI